MEGCRVRAPTLKAIETVYNGYRFRSRLEARWAVFFDALGVPYEYEKEGFDLGEAGWYLPDFWLPKERKWVEIKPAALSASDEKKVFGLADAYDAALRNGSHKEYSGVVVLIGEPYLDSYSGKLVRATGPDANTPRYWHGWKFWICPVCRTVDLGEQYSAPELFQCQTCDVIERERWLDTGRALGFRWHKGFWDLEDSNWIAIWQIRPQAHPDPEQDPALISAYLKARQARFEHGESGQWRSR
jgi:hypothetical protein